MAYVLGRVRPERGLDRQSNTAHLGLRGLRRDVDGVRRAQTDVKGASALATGTALTRYVGVKVDAGPNTPTGASSTAVVTYTLTIR